MFFAQTIAEAAIREIAMISHKTLATAAALAHNAKGATQQAHDLLAGYIKTLEAERDSYKQDAERYRWLKSRKGLTLTSDKGGCQWTRMDGTKFTPTHYLAEGDTQHAPCENLDDAIDMAMLWQRTR